MPIGWRQNPPGKDPLFLPWTTLHQTIRRLHRFRGSLVAAGGGPDAAGLIRPRFVQLAGGSAARVAIVPTASYMASTRDAYRAIFHQLGVAETWLVDPEGSQVDDPSGAAALRAASGICVTGGDQKQLVRELGGSLTARGLVESLEAGTPLLATSAATVALGDQMVGGLDADDRLLTMPGLGILPGLTLETHLTQRNRHHRIRELAERRANPVLVGLDEDTALLFEPNSSRARVHGTGKVVLLYWRDRWHDREMHPGETMDLRAIYPLIV